MLTVWTKNNSVMLHMLSDDPEDGTPAEQINYLTSLHQFAGYTCVSSNYTGPVPATDPSLWRWAVDKVVVTPKVPEVISPRQCRLMLLQMGLLASVEQMVQTQSEAVKIAWEYATEFRRDHPLLLSLSANLNLKEDELDTFFIEAAKL